MKRNVFQRIVVALWFCFLFLMSASASAHVRWDPNGAIPPRDQGFASCNVAPGDPTFLTSGTAITVSWEVAITHGQAMRIDLIYDGGDSSTLVQDNIPESPGFSSMAITLPDIECDECWLRIYGSGYESCADVQLTENGMPPSDPMDTQAPADVSNFSEISTADTQVVLGWSNPASDFSGVLVLMSEMSPDTLPSSGTAYELGDQIGNAEVVYKGAGEMASISNLTRNTSYTFKVHSYDFSLNYADGSELNVLTTDVGNSQPTVGLNVLQGTDLTTQISIDGGLVIVQAVINDPDSGDTHTLDWSQTDGAISDVDLIEDTFSFDPEMVAAGNYTIRVEVFDSGTPQFSANNEVQIAITEPPAQQSSPPVQADNGDSGGSGSSTLILLLMLCIAACRNIYLSIRSC